MAQGAGGGTVLVVEDDEPIRALIGSILSTEGIDHELTANGPEALRVSGEGAPAVVLLDMHPPYFEVELVVEAFQEEFGHELPILAMSASNEASRAERMGAYGFVPKPFEIDHLLRQVRRGMDLAERSHHLRAHSDHALTRLNLLTERQNLLVGAAQHHRRLEDVLLDAEFLLVQLATFQRYSGPHLVRNQATSLADLHRRLDQVERELRLRGAELGVAGNLTLAELRRHLAQLGQQAG